MDWPSFFFGLLTGITVTGAIIAALGWRWMRPFMRAAQKRASGTDSPTPPVMWSTTGQPPGSTGNDPSLVWPPKGVDPSGS